MNRIEKMASKVAQNIVAEQDMTLEQLRGGWHMTPRFPSGRNFVLLVKSGVYVRGPYGSMDFRGPIPYHHMFLELGLHNAPDEVQDAFKYYGGDYLKLLGDLEGTGEYFVKRIQWRSTTLV
jgi:hypothetical protein